MIETHGTFVWYELMTSDIAGAERFYRSVVGWSAADAGMPGMTYVLLSAGGTAVAGLMTLPDEVRQAGGRPGWLGYITVDDVDADAAAVAAAGGTVHRAADDIPGVGRFAVVADPQGTVFALFKGASEGPPPAPRGTPGHAGWHELLATDGASAFDFYGPLFGWRKDEALDMGPIGTYQLFKPRAGDDAIGGMMTKPKECPGPLWNFYFNVPAIDAAVERVTAAGGQIVNGPMEVPGGAWIVQGIDPQGAMFSLVAPPKG